MDLVYDSARSTDQSSRKFDLDDACRLKSNPALVGHVCRTHFDVDSHEPLGELLILSYTSVPDNDLKAFLNSGTPPRGYVFVSFTEPSQGNALIHEDDLVLVDRPLELGQSVKRHIEDTISGTVISKSSICSLEPIAWRPFDPSIGDYGPLKFSDRPLPNDGSFADDMGPPQIHNVPMSDLVNYEEFSEDDYIIYQQKLGQITAVDRDAVLLLNDNKRVVWPTDPGALGLPIYRDSSNVVALPNNLDDIRGHPLANGEFIWTTEFDSVFPGQFAFTAPQNLSRVDRGSTYGPNSHPQGYVLASPPMEIHVDWLCPNVFAVGLPYGSVNSETLRASALHGHAVKCDFGEMPADISGARPVKSDSWLRIGDRVRFRDPKDASAKRPLYQHILPGQSFGYDLNILRIVSTQSEATVQWQDGIITTESAMSLHTFWGANEEIWPGNLVVLKDSVEATRKPYRRGRTPLPRGFDDMCDVLCAKKIGVVQTVNSRERIASVRWYRDPEVELLHEGQTLRPRSYLGELGDTITDVSLYELHTYNGIQRELNDLVLLAPETIHQSTMIQSYPDPALFTGPCLLSYLAPVAFLEIYMYLEAMKMALLSADWFLESTNIDTSPLPQRYSVNQDGSGIKPSAGFIGKIVSMDTDGVLTLRLLGTSECRDVRIPFERIMLVIDERDDVSSDALSHWEMFNPDADTERGVNIYQQARGFARRITEHFQDEDWETEDEDDMDDEEDGDALEVPRDTDGPNDDLGAPEVSEITDPDPMDIVMDDAQVPEAPGKVSEGKDPSKLSTHLPSSLPDGFSMLESLPPSDHHFLSHQRTATSGQRAKRLRKEFEILQSSLPPGIFFRTWESRMDLARVLIIGPQGTPYEHAPFVIDFHFTANFPTDPPATFFHSWTNGQGSVNPNLYEDGNICLSILGTWHTENPEETWSPVHSTVLQILVSLAGLVLVKAPFYNEAGYEILAAEGDRRIDSTQYTERTFLMTRRFIKHALEHPVDSMQDVLAWHYLPHPAPDGSGRPYLIRRAIEEALGMIEHHNRTASGELDEHDVASGFVSRLSLGAVVMLRKHITELEKVELDFLADG